MDTRPNLKTNIGLLRLRSRFRWHNVVGNRRRRTGEKEETSLKQDRVGFDHARTRPLLTHARPFNKCQWSFWRTRLRFPLEMGFEKFECECLDWLFPFFFRMIMKMEWNIIHNVIKEWANGHPGNSSRRLTWTRRNKFSFYPGPKRYIPFVSCWIQPTLWVPDSWIVSWTSPRGIESLTFRDGNVTSVTPDIFLLTDEECRCTFEALRPRPAGNLWWGISTNFEH